MRINPKETALLVVDMQKDYCSPDGKLFFYLKDIPNIEEVYRKEYPEIISKINNFISKVRGEGIQIFWIKSKNDFIKYQFPHSPLKKENLLCAEDSIGSQIYLGNIDKKDQIIEKNSQNAFSNPLLKNLLKQNNIKNVILVGFFTSRCIRSSAQGAFENNFGVILPEDLVVDFPSNISNKLEYSLEELKDSWAIICKSDDLFY